MNKPDDLFLEESLPIELWEAAEKQAKRSTLNKFKTGAVIFDKDMNIIGRGCSHDKDGHYLPTVHAEYEALRDSYGARNYGEQRVIGQGIVIVSINKAKNYTYSSRPCLRCAAELHLGNIRYVYYAERLNDGEWIINVDSPVGLLNRAEQSGLRAARFAREMKIKGKVI
jgi:deoxycytidylate deaminase